MIMSSIASMTDHVLLNCSSSELLGVVGWGTANFKLPEIRGVLLGVGMNSEWADEEWDEYMDESAAIRGGFPPPPLPNLPKTPLSTLHAEGLMVVHKAGHTITVRRRNLERKDGDWQDPNFFADDYTVAAATGARAHLLMRVQCPHTQMHHQFPARACGHIQT